MEQESMIEEAEMYDPDLRSKMVKYLARNRSANICHMSLMIGAADAENLFRCIDNLVERGVVKEVPPSEYGCTPEEVEAEPMLKMYELDLGPPITDTLRYYGGQVLDFFRFLQ